MRHPENRFKFRQYQNQKSRSGECANSVEEKQQTRLVLQSL